jgi:hypothetical protein
VDLKFVDNVDKLFYSREQLNLFVINYVDSLWILILSTFIAFIFPQFELKYIYISEGG